MSSSKRRASARHPDIYRARAAIEPLAYLMVPTPETGAGLAVAASAGALSPQSDLKRVGDEITDEFKKRRLHDLKALRYTWLEREPAVRDGSYRRLDRLGAITVDFATEMQRDDGVDIVARLGRGLLTPVADFALRLPSPDLVVSGGLGADRPAEFDTARETARRIREETGIEDAHRKGRRGAGVSIGVLDTGVDADHDEFRGKDIDFAYFPLRYQQPRREVRGFDVAGHGSHVTSIIGGRTVGIAPDATLLVGGVIESESLATSASRVTRGLEWWLERFEAPENAGRPRIINLSLGFDRELIRSEQIRGLEKGLHDRMTALRMVLERTAFVGGSLVFAAMGNEGPKSAAYPALFEDVIGVGAVEGDLRTPAAFSGSAPRRKKPEFYGPGVSVLAAHERGVRGDHRYAIMSGTSMATPFCAAVAALIWEARPGASADEVLQIMTADARSIRGVGRLPIVR